MGRLLSLFILLPLADLGLLLYLSGFMGWRTTLLLVVVTGVLGAWLFRREGRRSWRVWQTSLARGSLPEEGVLGAAMLLVGGAWLLTPGVLTDLLGFALLLPFTRVFVARALRRALAVQVEQERAERSGPATTFERRTVGPQGATFVRVVRMGPMPSGVGPAGTRAPEPVAWTAERVGPSRLPTRPSPLPTSQGAPGPVIDADFEVTEK
ncbi:MAG: FxsA family protein [Myxococcota bacterium]